MDDFKIEVLRPPAEALETRAQCRHRIAVDVLNVVFDDDAPTEVKAEALRVIQYLAGLHGRANAPEGGLGQQE
jgi:DUF971 family protein